MCPPGGLPSLPQLLSAWEKRMVGELTSPAALEEAFRVLDRDGDGELASTDLLNFFKESMHHSMSQDEAQAMIAIADLDGKGSVNLSEFRCLVENMKLGDAAATVGGIYAEAGAMGVLLDVFAVLDVDKDGLISPVDLRAALPSAVFSDTCIDDMLAAAQGGKPIEFHSFAQLFMNAEPCFDFLKHW